MSKSSTASVLASSTKGHVPALDGVRGLAILIVYVYHARNGLPDIVGADWLKYPLHLFSMWWTGVDIFFALSGFLITNILIARRNDQSHLKNFYARRVLRIFPLFYATLVGYFLIGGVLGMLSGADEGLQWWYWLYAQNWLQAMQSSPYSALPHFWSLAIEEQFYLIWPLILLPVVNKMRGVQLCAAVVVSGLVLRTGLALQEAPSQFLHFSTLTRADALAWGALPAFAGYCYPRDKLLRWSKRGLVVAVSVVLLVTLNNPRSPLWGNMLMSTLGYTAVGAASAAFIVLVVLQPETRTTRMLTGRGLLLLGKYSYGIYVFHWPVMVLALPHFKDGDPSVLKGLGYLFVCALATGTAAATSWRLVESPVLRLKRYF